MKNDLMQRVYNKNLPFSFIDDTGLSLYGFDVKNKYEVISFDKEKGFFKCATTCGVTNKRRTENMSEDSLISMIKGNYFNKKEDSKKFDFMKIMGAS